MSLGVSISKVLNFSSSKSRISKLHLCEGGRERLTYDLKSDIKIKFTTFRVLYICLSVRRFVEGEICRTCVHCFV